MTMMDFFENGIAMNAPKISVIIPVYNAERYLPACIDGVLSQAMDDFEVLLVDDGSTDGSARICDDYAASDGRVRVFHKENGGVSAARNIGLDHATGEWVAFVDADDEVADGYLDVSPRLAGADVVQKPYVVVDGDRVVAEHVPKAVTLRERDDIFRFFVLRRTNPLWDKLIRRELIGSRRFSPEVSYGEDFLFFLALLPRVKQWAFDSAGAYRYFIRQESVSHSVDLQRLMGYYIVEIQHVQELTKSKDLLALQKSIYVRTYIKPLFKHRKALDEAQTGMLKEILFTTKIGNLKYVGFMAKLKLLLCRVAFLLLP